MSLWRSLRASARLHRVSPGVTVAAGIVIVEIAVGASAVDVTADGWMRFVSGLRRVGIVVRRRIRLRMRALISAPRRRRLSRLFCRASRWASIVRAKRVARLLQRSR